MKSLVKTLVTTSVLSLAVQSAHADVQEGFSKVLNNVRVSVKSMGGDDSLANIATYETGSTGRIEFGVFNGELFIFAETGINNSNSQGFVECSTSRDSQHFARLSKAALEIDATSNFHFEVQNGECISTALYDTNRDGVTQWRLTEEQNPLRQVLRFDPTDPNVFIQEQIFNGSSVIQLFNIAFESNLACENAIGRITPEFVATGSNFLTVDLNDFACGHFGRPDGIPVEDPELIPGCEYRDGIRLFPEQACIQPGITPFQ